MNASTPDRAPEERQNSGEGRPARRTIWKSRSTLGTVIAILVVGIYTLVAPAIRQRTGCDLPTLRADAGGNVRIEGSRDDLLSPRSDSAGTAESNGSGRSEFGDSGSGRSDIGGVGSRDSASSATKSKSKPVADAASSRPPKQNGSTGDKSGASQADDSASDLLYGRLKEIGRDRYLSIAGVLYTPGSAEGHRLEHLKRHTKDQPGRSGKHGVFDGGMDGAIKVIDQAYERTKKKQRTRVRKDGRRTIYTVDMGKRVGFVGGREGNRRRKPMARQVCLVMEDNRLITAYPL